MNSKPIQPATTIKNWLASATARLSEANIPSARLDAELILAYVLDVDRTWLIAHADDSKVFFEDFAFPATASHDKNHQMAASGSEKIALLSDLIEKRTQRIPLAYLLGTREFYGRTFIVTPDVLIPRPETEVMIEKLRRLLLPKNPVIHDVGTGSGCIAITLALELPSAHVSASDISAKAIKIARANANKLNARVDFMTDDLMETRPSTGDIDVIVANLPYVDPEWQRSPETDHEPELALFADDNGLALIRLLVAQAQTRLATHGYLLLEADPTQHHAIIKTGATHGLRLVETDDYIVILQKS